MDLQGESLGHLQLALESQQRKVTRARDELKAQCKLRLFDDFAIDEAAAKLTTLSIELRRIRGAMESR